MSKKTERLAKAICGMLNEAGDASTADMTPSFYKIDGTWFDVDPVRRNSFIVSNAVGRYDKRTPRYRVTVEEIV
jgi:hypothetical protein